MSHKTDYKAIKENVRITDYARSIGLTPFRVGSYFSLKEHDSVRIDPKKNIFYRNSTGEHGTVIDFALAFTNMTMREVLAELESYGDVRRSSGHDDLLKEGSDENVPTVGTFNQKDLVLPPRAKTMRNVYAYLTKTRGISKAVVDRMVKENMLYQDDHNNCVFVSYDSDGTPVFACKRGTNTSKRYVADVPGSDYSKGFMIRNGHNNTLCVVESVIDAMSYMTLFNGREDGLPDILCLSGVSKDDCVYNVVSGDGYDKLVLALDNDNAGFKARLRIQEMIMWELLPPKNVINHIPKYKDWNEDLVWGKGRHDEREG